MKKIFYILIVIFPLVSHAQKQGNKWYFGSFAALDFNAGAPVPIVTSDLATNEGSASIADKNTGNLLFYTDGTSVWDRTNNPMSNGYYLGGDPSSTQSALIVPKPGSSSLYYIFTVDAQVGYYSFGSGGLNYSIVDMTLNGGLGDVSIANQLLLTPTTEKLCGTIACNGTDVWVIAHLWNSDAFYAYLITKNGISAPVITHCGITHMDIGSGVNAESIGYMKISPNGKKLALACYVNLNTVQIFDFNSSTGVVSNPATDTNFPDFSGSDGPYGVSFSPDNSKLYVGYAIEDSTLSSDIYQYDMQAGDSTAIIASRLNVDSVINYVVGALQNGPDGKMYVAKLSALNLGDSLDVINNPNAAGTSCNYVFNGLYLGGAGFNQSTFGLPNMIENFLSPPSSEADITPHAPSFCFGTGIKLTASGGTTYTWSPSTGLSATTGDYVIADPPSTTTYTIKATNTDGCSVTATDVLTIFPSPTISFTANGNKQTIDFTSDSATGGVTTYTWDFGDSSALSHDVNPAHTYAAVRTYYVCLTVYNNSNCSYTYCQYVDLTKTGVQNISGQSDFQLYPNPASNKLLVVSDELAGKSIEITNVLGQTLVTQAVLPGAKQTTIDISSLTAGVYLLEIKSGQGMAVKKFVKE